MAGLPVLASHMDAVSEVLDTYDAGQILPLFTPETIGAKINAMLADHSALERMQRNAQRAAQEALNWEIESQRLIQLYRRILGRDPVPPRPRFIDNTSKHGRDPVPSRPR